MIQTNTHHAYLNHMVTLSSDKEGITVITDSTTGRVYKFTGSLDLHLSAGEHILCDETNNQVKVVIEDAIKIGGSKFKPEACFVTDQSPWVFVTMKDRLYISNKIRNIERVEYGITPDEIIFANNENDALFILRTENDYTVFDAGRNEVLFMFSNMEYHNDHLVIYKDQDSTTIVYDFVNGHIVYSFDREYSIFSKDGNDILYFISGSKLLALNLVTDEIEHIKEVTIDGDKVIARFSGLYVESHGYHLYENKLLLKTTIVDLISRSFRSISLPRMAKVNKFLDKSLLTQNDFEELLDSFRQASVDQMQKYPFVVPTANLVSYEKLLVKEDGLHMRYILRSYEIQTRYVRRLSTEYRNQNLTTGEDTKMSNNEFYDYVVPRPKRESNTTSPEFVNGTLLALAENKNEALVERDGCIYIVKSSGEEKQILSHLYDSTFCTNAFFTSDGKHVLLEKSIGVRDFFELDTYESSSFPIEGVKTIPYIGMNGYKPLADSTMPGGASPVWVDPMTMRRINPSMLVKRSYISPDESVVAETNFKSVLYNNLTQKEVTANDVMELREKYNWLGKIEEKEKQDIIALREELVSKNQEVFISQAAKYLHVEDEDEKAQKALDNLIKSHLSFTDLFIDRLDYVSYKINGIEKDVLIGRTAWFLNYVSFSNDSRYMAFGAKMNSDFFRCSQDGVFVIYDMHKDEEVLRMDSEQGLWAVWTTQFSRRNDVACYDGQPKTYIKMNGTEEVLSLNNRSFLCFSPSGRYMALSQQGYIDYTHHPDADWGHQPSTNVYVHHVDSSATLKFEGPYCDLGEDIYGTSKSTQRYNIASAAFSIDEKRLLMVGEDGVVVVRNIHLDDIDATTMYVENETSEV